MSIEYDSRDTPAQGTKSNPACRGRDTRKGAHDDDGTESTNNPPNHGKVTNSPVARFLEDVDPGTGVDELAERWREYRRRRGLDTEQASITGWSE